MAVADYPGGHGAESSSPETTKQGGRRSDLYETHIGLLIAIPGDTAGGRLLATLLPGRTYALICALRDTPDAQPHVMLGMLAAFTVTER